MSNLRWLPYLLLLAAAFALGLLGTISASAALTRRATPLPALTPTVPASAPAAAPETLVEC